MASARSVEFFFSPGSRYCYLAGSQLPRIASRTRCRFDWRPVPGTEVRRLRGRDPFQGEPASHEFDFDLLARAAAAATRPGASESYGARLCGVVYGSGRWPLDRAVCLELAEQQGLPRARFLQALDETATGDLLTQNARDACARGAFGVPTFFLDGVMFWGNDRLVLLEHALAEA